MAKYGYCFTLNNYTEAQYQKLYASIGQCGIQYICVGREGKEATPHLQGYLQSNQKNKSRFHDKLEIYVTPQRETAIQARDYCKKEGDWIEQGSFNEEIKGWKEKNQGTRTDIMEVKASIARGDTYSDICLNHFATASRCYKFIKEQIQERDSNEELKSSLEEYKNVVWRPWQQEILTISQAAPHPRKIHWIWESTGNTGKSFLAKYLAAAYRACLMKPGKQGDLAHIISKTNTRLYIFDLSRTNAPSEGREHFLDSAYSLAEDLKNGVIQSTKYDSMTMIRKTATVLFFANFPPDLSKWSEDRYEIKHL